MFKTLLTHFTKASLPKQTLLAIDVVVIGGSVAGLACAIALRRVGHRVLVLEKNDESEPVSFNLCNQHAN
jgi:salicylate hydroxylase